MSPQFSTLAALADELEKGTESNGLMVTERADLRRSLRRRASVPTAVQKNALAALNLMFGAELQSWNETRATPRWSCSRASLPQAWRP
jgi:hypothetical protein